MYRAWRKRFAPCLFWELYLEDDCTNHSGNKVMDIQHNNLVTGKNNFVRFE